jgi:hypothetical protein
LRYRFSIIVYEVGMATRADAFGTYDIVLRNPNWSLSGRSADDGTVAVSLWQDELGSQDGRIVFSRLDWGDWYDGPGRRYWFEDLAWARDHCGNIVRLVISVRDRHASGRVQTLDNFARPNVLLRVTHLDPAVGAFRLEQIN